MPTYAAQKKPVGKDWHPADVIAELRKLNWSLRQLALANGISDKSLYKAQREPYPRAEAVIAAALGVEPKVIWPSRYDANGKPNRPVQRPVMNGPAGLHARSSVKSTAHTHGRNLQAAQG